MSLSSEYVMSLPPGMELNALVTAELDKIGVDEDTYQAWSNNPLAAIALLDIVSKMETVGILLSADAPNIICQMAAVGVDGDDGDSVAVYTDDWGESLAKAFLLYRYDFHGDYMHPEWERKKREAPKRLRRVK